MTRGCLDGDEVADGEGYGGGIFVKSLAGVLELHLHDVEVGFAAGDVLKPVVAVQLAAWRLLPAAPVALAACRGLLRCRPVGHGACGGGFLIFIVRHGAQELFCEADGAGLADDGDFHLTGVGHLVLDALCYLSRELFGLGVVNLVGADYHAQFAACLDGIGLDDAGVGEGELFEDKDELEYILNSIRKTATAKQNVDEELAERVSLLKKA